MECRTIIRVKWSQNFSSHTLSFQYDSWTIRSETFRTGTIAGDLTDDPLAYAGGDPNNGANPNIVSSAYSNNFFGAPSTVLYNIDASLDILVTQSPPNNGTLNTIGALGVNTSDIAGFDISGSSGIAYAALENGGTSSLYTINLTTGAATLVGAIGSGLSVNGLTAVPEPEHYALIAAGSLIGFALLRRRFKQA